MKRHFICVSAAAGFIYLQGVLMGLKTHLQFLRKRTGVGLSQVRLQVLQGVFALRQTVWQVHCWGRGLQGALDKGLKRGTGRSRQRGREEVKGSVGVGRVGADSLSGALPGRMGNQWAACYQLKGFMTKKGSEKAKVSLYEVCAVSLCGQTMT